jgi:hypothetical protein
MSSSKRAKSGQVVKKLIKREALASRIGKSREIEEKDNAGFGRMLPSLCDSGGNGGRFSRRIRRISIAQHILNLF